MLLSTRVPIVHTVPRVPNVPNVPTIPRVPTVPRVPKVPIALLYSVPTVDIVVGVKYAFIRDLDLNPYYIRTREYKCIKV